MIQQEVTIDSEFQALIPPLSVEERNQLEVNLLEEGCRDSLILWQGVLLDGHNRYEICQAHGLDFDIKSLELSDRQSAINWIINNQLGRRNLYPDQASYLRGKRYNGEKQAHGGQEPGSRDQNDPSIRTADRLASEFKVSAPTLKRDGNYAAAVDTLQAAGIAPQRVIAHQPKAAVVEFAKLITPEPEPPAAPLLPPDPPKPKDPIIAAVTEKVKSGEMTVVEAAKAIKVATSTGEFHVSQGNNDWYTPAEYLEAARKVMNGIDLDPASSDLAQKVVQAKAYFTAERCGLNQPWNGKVWLNPPFSMPLIEQFTDKLLAEWRAGNIDQAIVITNNATDTGWFHSLLSESKLACLTKGRVKFYSPANEGMAPRQGQAFFYLGDQQEQFVKTFSSFGLVIHL